MLGVQFPQTYWSGRRVNPCETANTFFTYALYLPVHQSLQFVQQEQSESEILDSLYLILTGLGLKITLALTDCLLVYPTVLQLLSILVSGPIITSRLCRSMVEVMSGPGVQHGSIITSALLPLLALPQRNNIFVTSTHSSRALFSAYRQNNEDTAIVKKLSFMFSKKACTEKNSTLTNNPI